MTLKMDVDRAWNGLYELQREIHETTTEKGWHDEPRTFGDMIALGHSELSEALEAYRVTGDPAKVWRVEGKPEGVASELADVIIRILDMSQELEIPTIDELFAKMEYNKTRPFRHGGKAL